MFQKIRLFIFYLFRKIVPIEFIIKAIEDDKIENCIQQCEIAKTGRFYPESKVFNFQNNISQISIGENSHIKGELIVFPYGGKIQIGKNCYIGESTRVWSGESIIIGNNVGIAHNINIVDFAHKTNHLKRAEEVINIFKYGHPKEKEEIPTAPIIIEDYVAIYPNSSILRGVKIGKGAIISTGSVVMNDVAPFTIVMGNPARTMGKVSSE